MYASLVLLLIFAVTAIVLSPLLLWLLVFGAVVFLPLYLTVQSVMALLLVPQQLLGILTNRRLRTNHALEHATVNVLEEQLGPTSIAGVATGDGFVLMGGVPSPRHVVAAAQVALARLKRGETTLALHPRCGTSLAAANLLFALVFLGGLLAVGAFDWLNALLALAAAHLLGRPVGMLLQKWITTDPDVADLDLVDVAVEGVPAPFVFAPALVGPQRYHFRTAARDARPLWRSARLPSRSERQFVW